jgi:hypothetical protein
MKYVLISLAASLALAACTTAPTVYQPAETSTSVGYRETRIESDRYRISFRANADLEPGQVEDMALRRAAELAVADGYPWFRVVTRMTELAGGSPGGGTSVGVGGSSGSYGSGIGVGIGFDLSGDTRKYETTMEVQFGRGDKPDEANAYEAQAVLQRLG